MENEHETKLQLLVEKLGSELVRAKTEIEAEKIRKQMYELLFVLETQQ